VLDVYTWEPNANSGKPLLMLKEKGADFAYHYIDMGKMEHHSPEYLKVNPNGTIPTVIHDGLTMIESTPAMEYLDKVLDGPRLVPHDPYEAWRMRWWCRYLDTSVTPALAMVASNMLAAPRYVDTPEAEKRAALERIPLPERRRTWELLMRQGTRPEQIEDSKRRIAHCIGLMNEELSQRKYLAGDAYSLADVTAMISFYGWPAQRADEVNDEKTPALMDWYRRCHARKGVREAFKLGNPFFAARVVEVRKVLGIEE
jgi:GSH-dependent disulfide-bond oxidoreductase